MKKIVKQVFCFLPGFSVLSNVSYFRLLQNINQDWFSETSITFTIIAFDRYRSNRGNTNDIKKQFAF